MLTAGFQGRLWPPPPPGGRDAAVRTEALTPATETLDRAVPAAAALAAWAPASRVDRCSLKAFRFLLAEPRLDEAWSRLVRGGGQGPDGHRQSLRAEVGRARGPHRRRLAPERGGRRSRGGRGGARAPVRRRDGRRRPGPAPR
ncbi:MAG: hypothetical protein R3F43_17320 [bacterium]